MLRAIFHIAAVLSLLLFLLTVCFWARSYYVTDTFMHSPRPMTAWSLATGNGQVQWCQVTMEYDATVTTTFPPGEGGWQTHEPRYVDLGREPSDPPERGIDWLGFQTCFGEQSYSYIKSYRYSFMILPLWFIAMLTSILPFFLLMSLIGVGRGRRWQRMGLCGTCGYDLRGNSASTGGGGTCPECGAHATVIIHP